MKVLFTFFAFVTICMSVFAEDPLDSIMIRWKTNNIVVAERNRICDEIDLATGNTNHACVANFVTSALNSNTNDFWDYITYSRVQFINNGTNLNAAFLSNIQGTNSVTNQFEIKIFAKSGWNTNGLAYYDIFIPSIIP